MRVNETTRLTVVALLLTLAASASATEVEARLPDGFVLGVGESVSPVGAATGITVGYDFGRSAILLGANLLLERDTIFSTDSNGNPTTSIQGNNILGLSPTYRYYFSALRPHAIAPFLQAGFGVSVQAGGDTGVSWNQPLVSAAAMAGAGVEYVFARNFAVVIGAEALYQHQITPEIGFGNYTVDGGYVVGFGGFNLHL